MPIDADKNVEAATGEVQGYYVLSGETVEQLAEKVNADMKNSQHPYGDPFIFRDRVCQAMTASPQN